MMLPLIPTTRRRSTCRSLLQQQRQQHQGQVDGCQDRAHSRIVPGEAGQRVVVLYMGTISRSHLLLLACTMQAIIPANTHPTIYSSSSSSSSSSMRRMCGW
jgi:hypothetical protein